MLGFIRVLYLGNIVDTAAKLLGVTEPRSKTTHGSNVASQGKYYLSKGLGIERRSTNLGLVVFESESICRSSARSRG